MRKRPSSASLFLLELIASIFLFVLAAVLCIGLFAKAEARSKAASAHETAVQTLSNMRSLIRTSETEEEMKHLLTEAYPDLTSDDQNMQITVSDSADRDIVFTLSYVMNEDMLEAEITAKTDPNEEIVSMQIRHRMDGDEQ